MMTEKNLIFNSEGIRVVMTHIAGYPGRYNRDAIELIQNIILIYLYVVILIY